LTEFGFFANVLPILKDSILLFITFVAFILCLPKWKINKNLIGIYIFIFLFLSINMFLAIGSSAGKVNIIYNLRRMFTLLIAFITFSILPLTNEIVKRIKKVVVLVTYVVCLFGLFEYFLPDSFWDKILKIPLFWKGQSIDPWGASKIANSGRFYTYDLYFILGRTVRRMVSFYCEPTTLGSFLSFVLPFYAFEGRCNKKKIIFISLIVVSGLLVMSKAFILTILVVLFFSIFRKADYKKVVLFTICFYVFAMILTNMGLTKGPFSHIYGFYSSFNIIITQKKYFGYGIAKAGNYKDAYDKTSEIIGGGESGFGNMVAQSGVVAFIFIIIIFLILRIASKNYHYTRNNDYYAIFVAMVCWYLIYLYSASSLGFSGNIFFFMFSGILLNNQLLLKNYEKSSFFNTTIALSTD